MTNIRTPEVIATEINSWNKRSVYQLRDLINELNDYRDEGGNEIDVEQYVDCTNLPTAQVVPDNLSDRPVWTIDENGDCLTGDDMSHIERLADLVS